MGWNDDEEELSHSPSKAEELTRADKGKKDALKRKIKEKTGREADRGRVDFRSEMELKQLQSELAGQMDDEDKKRKEKLEEKEYAETFGTKTLMQEEEATVESADMKTDDEKLIEQDEREETEKEEAGGEYQQQMG